MRHEPGHDMIAKGEVDIDKVRERIKQILQTESLSKTVMLFTLLIREEKTGK